VLGSSSFSPATSHPRTWHATTAGPTRSCTSCTGSAARRPRA
jgi:hypothetical protein